MTTSHSRYQWPQAGHQSSLRFHQEIPISEVGNQSGRDRILEWLRYGADDVRTLPPWRNNLTALSRVHNLYFVADGSRLLVYRPEYPSQKLSTFAVGTMDLPESRPDLVHYMPQGPPHCINNVLVADLGNKEILLCACDDGDVLGYWTDSLQYALPQKIEEPEEKQEVQYPLPFFHQNVKVSAWGLAVHTNARLIAVTSNSHVVTIFAFALTELPYHGSETEQNHTRDPKPFVPKHFDKIDNFFQNPNSSDYDPGWYMVPTVELETEEDKNKMFRLSRDSNIENLLRDRARNYVFKLYGHRTNIPCVAFNNSDEDLLGHWLLSSDISGLTIVWDLAHMTRHRATRLNNRQMRTAGWGVFWLDRRSFRKTQSANEALVRAEYYVNSKECIVDVSCGRGFVQNFVSRTQLDELSDEESAMEDTEDDALEAEEPLELATPMSPILRVNSPNSPLSVQGSSHTSTPGSPRAAGAHSILTRKQLLDSTVLYPPVLTPHRRQNLEEVPVRMLEHCHWRDDARDISDPDTPVLLISAHSLQLWQSPVFQHMNAFSPSVYLQYPLSQRADEDEEAWAIASDRLNMNVMIEELGVLLCGSGKGSVAVFTLHSLLPNPMISLHSKTNKHLRKSSPRPKSPRMRSWSDSATGPSPSNAIDNAKAKNSRDPPNNTGRPLYAMRLDWVLPFESQLQLGLRPHQPLVGVAAAPVQGTAAARGDRSESTGSYDKQDSRDMPARMGRWRILLMYRDHTVFAYEIGWASSMSGPQTGPGQELEILIV